MTWVSKNQERGYYVDEFGSTHVYPDGKTQAQRWPAAYFQCPCWVGWLLLLTEWAYGAAQEFAAHWDTRTEGNP